DALFDYLFRKHLQNIYTLLGDTPPPVLSKPIGSVVHRKMHTDPRGFLQVRVDGRFTYFEWVDAGLYHASGERGTMARVTPGLVRELYFGFDAHRLLIRLDCAEPAGKVLREHNVESLRVTFPAPAGFRIVATGIEKDSISTQLQHDGESISGARVEMAVAKIVELAA